MHSQSEHLFVKSTKETARVFLYYMKQSACLKSPQRRIQDMI